MYDPSETVRNPSLKTALYFADAGYLVAIILHFVKWRFPLASALLICPAYLLTTISMTDPSFGAIALIIAPVNAFLYGILGVVVGLGVRSRVESIDRAAKKAGH